MTLLKQRNEVSSVRLLFTYYYQKTNRLLLILLLYTYIHTHIQSLRIGGNIMLILFIFLSRTWSSCRDQRSHSPRQCSKHGGGADEPRGTTTNRLPNCCQPLSGWAFQFAATRGAGETSCVTSFQIYPLVHACKHWDRDTVCTSITSCLWSRHLCLLVGTESRGAECCRGDAVCCSGAEWSAWHQRPPGCDRAINRLPSGLHQHRPRQPQQVRDNCAEDNNQLLGTFLPVVSR